MFSKGFATQPPQSNRGAKPDNVSEYGIDWYAFTIPGDKHSDVWEIAAKYYPLQFSSKQPSPSSGYRQVTEFQDGPKVSQSDDRPEIHCQFSGQVMQMISLGEQVAMMREFFLIGGKPTRIDPRRDDFSKSLPPEKMIQWAAQGHLCRFKVWQPIQKYRGTVSQGVTFAAGRRGRSGSGIYMRFYEWHFGNEQQKINGRNNDGEFDAVRFEAELTSHKAVQFVESLVAAGTGQDIISAINQCIFGSIDFREGDSEKSFRDRPRLEEWADYIQNIPVYKYKRPKRVRPSSFPVDAFHRQWGGKLAALCQVSGADSFMRVIRDSIADGQRRGYGLAVPAERLLRLERGLKLLIENLSHTRRRSLLI